MTDKIFFWKSLYIYICKFHHIKNYLSHIASKLKILYIFIRTLIPLKRASTTNKQVVIQSDSKEPSAFYLWDRKHPRQGWVWDPRCHPKVWDPRCHPTLYSRERGESGTHVVIQKSGTHLSRGGSHVLLLQALAPNFL